MLTGTGKDATVLEVLLISHDYPLPLLKLIQWHLNRPARTDAATLIRYLETRDLP